ncbi:MAG: gamma-glutamyltransferase [Verrucomicrobia bacterium]|nr:gamma-glutamyltransferase [Verrucomicrobiota bacterium]MBT4275672.1 gamma-glutamyltransferase [Verrucomicrobiota bacterium]MBT5061964.1 gamma-glutamyltransferase [Verrucomicrobiota bacterium]MBT6806073.1 gamma-glutamyltransferase [Verrucomicrobiota bacterium]MBT7537230.1 gamma-glutamyltransferase [Verrucomicrobiota bacterium]
MYDRFMKTQWAARPAYVYPFQTGDQRNKPSIHSHIGLIFSFRILFYWFVILLVSLPSNGFAGKRGAVAAGHELAAQAGINALDRGGNAVDAAVAIGLTLGVVDGFNSGIGGGCFMLIRTPRGELVALDGRETAPERAHRDMYLRDGQAVSDLSQKGALAVGVPGALATFDTALRRYGKLKLADLLLPAAEIAESGFPVNQTFYGRVASVVQTLREFPEIQSVYLDAKLNPFQVGDTFVQPQLAESYRLIASDGISAFYNGPIAVSLAEWMRDHGGILTQSDMARYQTKFRTPVRSMYREFEIAGFPPPSSGGIHVAQILKILEFFDIPSMDRHSAEWIHLVIEAMKRAFADRAFWLGDSDYANVPLGLISDNYAKSLAEDIDPSQASKVTRHGTPPHADKALFGSHTTHYSAADQEGYWVACTATVNTTLGSKVMIPGRGIVLNNEMDDFSAQPGKANFFGLLGSEANAVQPGKRPLSSMSPTLVLKSGEPVLSVGAAGGPTIISQTLVHLLLILDFGLGVEEALAHPRFHHQWKPDRVVLEASWPSSVVQALKNKGHEVHVVNQIGAAQAVQRMSQSQTFKGASDPRINGSSMQW